LAMTGLMQFLFYAIAKDPAVALRALADRLGAK